MGKAGRWLRSFLTGKKAKDRGADEPAAKEKRRWSFRRPAASVSARDTSSATSGCHGKGQLASASSHCFSEVHVVTVQDQHAVGAAPRVVAITAATAPPEGSARDAEEAAAVKIQSAFRSYLARTALCALRGMVKLQAIVRGQLVRRQADMTLRRIQALVAAQRRARAERLRLRLLDDGTPPARTGRRSPQHHCSPRKPLSVAMQEESGKGIGEVDSGGGARRNSCCSTPAKAELYYNQKASPGPSGLTSDLSVRTFSGRFDEEHYSSASFSAAASEASGRHRGGKACHAHAASYMANTESSRAKHARSQSAPRHRPEAASPSRSYERPPSGGGGRRRASLDPRDLAGQVRAPSPRSSVDAGRVTPQDRPGASLAVSERGSSSSTALLLTSAAAVRIAK
ncbi:hypothetical protein CFC21_070085 [Triticum aestivum]|uniref:DUF4005 domain-containing protein n=3 Tax=Triticum TaxID=4564 RepID=A0A9R0WZV5_TRITD|nr:hypothetical protein CFC21_070085 [Triticum aestivum]VAI27483.1 unnamed protein product [Triticum turgidum subsp. durum]